MKGFMSYQPKTGAKCSCRPGVQRDNCPTCEGTGWVIDFRAIRAKENKDCEPLANALAEGFRRNYDSKHTP
jgi:hypothetical protein